MNSKLYFATTLLILFSSVYTKSNAQSQEWLWAKVTGGLDNDGNHAVAFDPNKSGDVYTTGFFEGTVDFDPGEGIFNLISDGLASIFISKFDSSGNLIWAKRIGGVVSEDLGSGRSIAVDPSGNGDIYITGFFRGTVDFDPSEETFNLTSVKNEIFISKFDNLGNFLWVKALAGTEHNLGASLAIDPAGSGDVYTTGGFSGTVDFDPSVDTFNLTSAGFGDIFISKLDRAGNFIWAKTMGGTDSDFGASIALDPAGSGNIYIGGGFDGTCDFDPNAGISNFTSAGNSDVYIAKLDSSGNFIWAKTMGGTDSDYGSSIAIDHSSSGDLYITGEFNETADFDPGADTFNLISQGYSNAFITKLDPSGNLIWAKALGGDYAEGASIAVDPVGKRDVYTSGQLAGSGDFDPGDGTFNLTGISDSQEIFISKLDSSGNFKWAIAIGGTGNDYVGSIAIDPTGNGQMQIVGDFDGPSISFGNISLLNAGGFDFTDDMFNAKLDILTTSVVNVNSKKQLITLYPNPTTDQLIITFVEDLVIDVDITICNILGEIILSTSSHKNGNGATIDISSLASGIYFIVIDIEGNSVVKKVVKE